MNRLPPWLRWWLPRAWTLTLRVVVGGVFVYASADKIAHPDRFADIVLDYDLLPWGVTNLFAVCLPWVELATGLLLLVGRWPASASLLATGMTAMFIAAIGVNLAWGNEHLNCGCFSTGEGGREAAWSLLWRDALLLLGAASIFVVTSTSSSHSTPSRSGR